MIDWPTIGALLYTRNLTFKVVELNLSKVRGQSYFNNNRGIIYILRVKNET